jgi:uncharacterized protein with HEPN domain
MPKDEDYLAHIRKAIREVKAHTAGMTQESYAADAKTQRAVERNLEIIGEAAHNLSDALKQAHRDVPWDSIYAARNVIVHFYFGVNQKILWDVVENDLDPLLRRVEELLGPEHE